MRTRVQILWQARSFYFAIRGRQELVLDLNSGDKEFELVLWDGCGGYQGGIRGEYHGDFLGL